MITSLMIGFFVIILIIILILLIEKILRLRHSAKKILAYDITNYPFFRKAKSSKGRDPYFIERIGKHNTPVISTYSEGIRGNITQENRQIVLNIGCSFTEGVAFKDEETYPGNLQTLLNHKYDKKYGVINAGIGGYGPFQMDYLLKKLVVYNPKVVIVQLVDFMRVPLNQSKIIAGRKYFLNLQKLKQKSLLLSFINKLRKPKFIGIRAPYMSRKLSKEGLWEKNLPYLDSMVKTCRENKAELVLFVWPSNDPKWLHNEFFHEKIKKYSKMNNINCFDARPIYSFYTPKELTVPNDAHPSSLANKLVSKATYECLVKNNIIK